MLQVIRARHRWQKMDRIEIAIRRSKLPMNRISAMRNAVKDTIGEETAEDAVIVGALGTVFSPDFLGQTCTEAEYNKMRSLLGSTPWRNEILNLLGVERD